MVAEPTTPSPGAPPPRHTPRYTRFLPKAPSPLISAGIMAAAGAVLALCLWWPASGLSVFLAGFLGVFLLPGLVAGALTPALAQAFGGRFTVKRSFLLAATVLLLLVPLALVYRLTSLLSLTHGVPLAGVVLFLQGPVLWFRHLSLFGVSNPEHARTLPASLLQPVVAIVGVFLFTPVSVVLLVAALLFLLSGFLTSALLLRAADRPLRREFGVSGVSLIRPLLDHVDGRDPAATAALESFFARFAFPANLRLTLLAFATPGGIKATLALPTVHPGPFAGLGSSDLPRKLEGRLGPASGLLFVPHTPCDHDLDLPTTREVERVADAGARLLASPPAASPPAYSGLVSPYEGSIARAQLLGDTALVLVSQAPAPTDDIAFAIADQLYRESLKGPGPKVAIIDAHNSYVEGQGDLTYGTPLANKLGVDLRAAVAAAQAAARPGALRAGIAVRTNYSIGRDGVGPSGIRCLVLEAHGETSAYVLIDGNNLLQGMRAPILEALRPLVGAAEVMTTDNHVVHEVDGGINPVGERYPVASLIADIVQLVRAAVVDLSPVETWCATTEIEGVPVLGPAWTARLLTSLGDTFSMFTNAFLTTFLLLLTSSLVVLVALA
ncbi:MAG: DUF2070 family protein [Candidatus Lutacidiplasmatales archaeon]